MATARAPSANVTSGAPPRRTRVLIEGGAIVIARFEEGRIDGHVHLERRLGLSRTDDDPRDGRLTEMRRPESGGTGHEGLDLARRADGREFLLPL